MSTTIISLRCNSSHRIDQENDDYADLRFMPTPGGGGCRSAGREEPEGRQSSAARCSGSLPEGAAVADVDVNRADPMEAWAEPLEAWLRDSGISEERSRRAVLAFGRFSAWVTGRGLGAVDVDEDVIDSASCRDRSRQALRTPGTSRRRTRRSWKAGDQNVASPPAQGQYPTRPSSAAKTAPTKSVTSAMDGSDRGGGSNRRGRRRGHHEEGDQGNLVGVGTQQVLPVLRQVPGEPARQTGASDEQRGRAEGSCSNPQGAHDLPPLTGGLIRSSGQRCNAFRSHIGAIATGPAGCWSARESASILTTVIGR